MQSDKSSETMCEDIEIPPVPTELLEKRHKNHKKRKIQVTKTEQRKKEEKVDKKTKDHDEEEEEEDQDADDEDPLVEEDNYANQDEKKDGDEVDVEPVFETVQTSSSKHTSFWSITKTIITHHVVVQESKLLWQYLKENKTAVTFGVFLGTLLSFSIIRVL